MSFLRCVQSHDFEMGGVKTGKHLIELKKNQHIRTNLFRASSICNVLPG